jgi:hypothetical protein
VARPKRTNGDAEAPNTEKASTAKPEDAAECFLEAREIKSSMARMSQKLSALYGRYENLGVDTLSIKECLKLEKDKNPPARLKRIMVMAAILNVIPTETEKDGQISVMPGLSVTGLNEATKEKIALANAYNDGYNTGLVAGSETNNKYPPGSEHRVKWSLGHIDGQAQRAIKRAGKPEKVAKQKRINDRAATQPPETQLEKDEASYRGALYDTGAEMPADPI